MLSGETTTLYRMAEPSPNRPPAGTVRVALEGVNGTTPWVNRFWLNTSYGSTPTATQLKALSDAVSAAWRTRFLSYFHSNVVLNKQRAVLYVDSTTEIGVDGADTGSGSDANTSALPQICLLINWSISGTYRGGHPRTYLPPPASDKVNSDGSLPGSVITALTTAADGFRTDVNALSPTPFTSVALGTVAFFRGHSALSPPVFKPFVAGAAHGRVATQRRRVAT